MNGAFKKSLADLFKARFPYLYIPTWEEDRAVAVIAAVAADESLIRTPRKLYQWSLTAGMVSSEDGAARDSATPLKALEFIESCSEPALFVLKDFHIFFGGAGRTTDPHVVRKVRDLVPALKQAAAPKNVVFISPTVVLPEELQKDITILDFDLPGFEEIRTVLRDMVEANRQTGRIEIALEEEDEERLARAALGLTLQEAENAFARAMVHDGRFDIDDLDVILVEKRQIIKKSQILEFVESPAGFAEIGGLENLKRWLAKRDGAWLEAAARYALPPPKGVLITGVPGCGKSLTAKCTSATWQLPLLRLDVGKIFAGIVGSSEENMRLALKTAEAISPSILWIDEIEKGFTSTGSAGDSGTSARVFGTFLTWMQEKTKPVFVFATANSIHALPPELLRKGRFDEIFFVDLPTRRERLDIFKVHLGKRLGDPTIAGDVKPTDEVCGHLADMCEGYTGAEIEQSVIAGLFEAFAESRALTMSDLETALSTMVPLSVTQAEQIRAIREWANVRAVTATAPEDRAGYAEDGESQGDILTTRGGRALDV